MTMDYPLHHMLEYRLSSLKKDLESVIRYNGKTLNEVENPEEQKIIKGIIDRIKESNLTERIFALPNPLFNIISATFKPWLVEFDARDIIDEILNQLSDIYIRVKTTL